MAIHVNLHRPTHTARIEVKSSGQTHWVSIEDRGYAFNVFTDTAGQAEHIAFVLNEMKPAPPAPLDDDPMAIPF